jgi:hypothetical protein
MNSEYRLPISDNKIGVNQFLILGILAHFRQFRHFSYVSPIGLAQHLAQ